MSNLAIYGGTPCIPHPHPHDIWPPKGKHDELEQLAAQRNTDIGIRGRTGPILEFEESFLQFLNHQARYAVTFNSGTSALLAAYTALGIGLGDEVIGPVLTYHAALSPVHILNGTVVLVDIDPDTRCIDHTQIEAAITERTKAITVVHQWGHPANMEAIMDISKKYNIPVIEDCSHAHGSQYKGQYCGTIGAIGIYSLQTNKAIFAGEGGILVTNNTLYHDRATLLGHYRDRSYSEVTTPNLHPYWTTGFGLKLRMSPFNALVASHSLKHFPHRKQQRHHCLSYFNERLKEIPYLSPVHTIGDAGDMGAWYGFKPLYIPTELNNIPRSLLVAALQAEGMEITAPSGEALYHQPLYAQSYNPIYQRTIPYSPQSTHFPNADYIQQYALSLPTFWNWDQDEIIINSYIDCFKKIFTYSHELLHHPSNRTSEAQ